MKTADTISQMLTLKVRETKGRGRRIATSTSKTRKIIAIIKNRREKGIREFEKGSNPHSKGEDFSRS